MPEARRYNVVPAMALGVAGTAAASTALGSSWELGGQYPLAAATAFVALAVVVVRAAGHAHPYSRFGPANGVTVVRAGLVALLAGGIGNPAAASFLWWAIGVTTLVTALDGVDGWLARRTRMASGFGARLDMETDAALILVLSIFVWQHQKAGAWVLLCGLMRYAFVAAGWMIPWMAQPLRSTWRGKAVAVVQFIGLGLALAPIVPPSVSTPIAAATLAALTWSFALDIRWLLGTHGSRF